MNIQDAIRQLAGSKDATFKLCRVDKVDKGKRWADCTPLDDTAPLLQCNLQANQVGDEGLILYPKEGAFVLVGILDGYEQGFVLCTDDLDSLELKLDKYKLHIDKNTLHIANNKQTLELTKDKLEIINDKQSLKLTADEMLFNGGKLGGLIKIQALTDKLNRLENKLNGLISKYNAHTHPVPPHAPGGAAVTTPTTSTDTPLTPLTKRSDYENKKVKH